VPTGDYTSTGSGSLDYSGVLRTDVHFGLFGGFQGYGAVAFSIGVGAKGAAIHSATLSLKSRVASDSLTPNGKIYVVDADSASAPTSIAELDALFAGAKTAGIDWDEDHGGLSYAWYDTPDLSSLVSEVTSRPGFSGSIVFLFEDDGSGPGNDYASFYGGTGSDAPQFALSYGAMNRVNEDRPMVTGQGYGGATGVAERPMMDPWARDYKFSGRRPMIEGRITTSDSTNYATVDAERPMISGVATQAYYGEVNAQRPMITAAGVGAVADGEVDADRPMITGLGHSGGEVDQDRPMITAVAAASSEISAEVAKDRPMITAAATTTDVIELDFTANRPMLSMAARGTTGIVLSLDQERPMITGELSANDDQHEITVDDDRPMIEGRIEASGPGACTVLRYGT
jgi:hypothetical protein